MGNDDIEKALQQSQPHVPSAAQKGVGQSPSNCSNISTLPDGVQIVSAAALTPRPVKWLWRNWLPLGKLVLLAGQPGVGKTTVAMGLAAILTSGGSWPDGAACEPGGVLIWSGEDDAEDTLAPRLLACGADLARVYFIKGTSINGKSMPFDPARDMPRLQKEIERRGDIRLLILDPVVSTVAGDSHKNTETRRALQPLVDLAAASDCCVLGITHLSKGGAGGDPTTRVIGSIAFAAVARVVLVAGRCNGDEGRERRILARSKSNLGRDDGGFEYQLAQVEPLPDVYASRVEWGPMVQGSARDLLADAGAESDVGKPGSAHAVEMVQEELAGAGWMPSAELERRLKAAGLTSKQIRSARQKLGLRPRRCGLTNVWYLHARDEKAGPLPGQAARQGAQEGRCAAGEHDVGGQGVRQEQGAQDAHLEVEGALGNLPSAGHLAPPEGAAEQPDVEVFEP